MRCAVNSAVTLTAVSLLQLAIQYAAAYHLSTEETAEVLADSFLKGLLAAHHDTEGSISDAWSAANFRDACEVAPRQVPTA